MDFLNLRQAIILILVILVIPCSAKFLKYYSSELETTTLAAKTLNTMMVATTLNTTTIDTTMNTTTTAASSTSKTKLINSSNFFTRHWWIFLAIGVISVIIVAAVIWLVIWCCCCRNRQKPKQGNDPEEPKLNKTGQPTTVVKLAGSKIEQPEPVKEKGQKMKSQSPVAKPNALSGSKNAPIESKIDETKTPQKRFQTIELQSAKESIPTKREVARDFHEEEKEFVQELESAKTPADGIPGKLGWKFKHQDSYEDDEELDVEDESYPGSDESSNQIGWKFKQFS